MFCHLQHQNTCFKLLDLRRSVGLQTQNDKTLICKEWSKVVRLGISLESLRNP